MLRPDPILLFAFSFAIWEQNCSAVDQEPKQSLYEQVSQNEDMWKAGKTSEYYQRATEIIKDIKGAAASGRTNLNEVAATLLDNLLSKEVRIEEVDDHFEVEDLSAMERVAGYLNLRQASSANERQRVGRLLSRYLGRIRKELIPDFKPNPTVQNVIPPPGTPGPMIAGMDPDAIDDPVAKAKYKAAIRQNHLDAVQNGRQLFLARCDVIAREQIINYLVEATNAGALTSADLAECVKSATLTEDEKKEVASKTAAK